MTLFYRQENEAQRGRTILWLPEAGGGKDREMDAWEIWDRQVHTAIF